MSLEPTETTQVAERREARFWKSRWYNAYFVFQKAATTVAYVFLMALTWRFIRHKLDWQLAAGCDGLSAFWIFLLRIKMYHVLQTYFDVFSRLEFVIPACMGIILSIVGFFAFGEQGHRIVAMLELLVWAGLIGTYLRNKSRYEKRGYGPVPQGTWISPPVSAMGAGDLILTSGNVARRLHETVGHAAAVIKGPDGRLLGLSSHMDRGTTLEPIENVVGEVTDGTYILLKLTQPVDEHLQERMYKVALDMVGENQHWQEHRNQAWRRFVNALSLPPKIRQWLLYVYRCTGYDWFGMFAGRLAQHRWTCIGAALEMYHRAGVQTNPYGTGLLGFGTTLFDPIMPVRFLADPAFRLVRKDRQESELTIWKWDTDAA